MEKNTDFVVHLNDLENIAADLEKLVESWKVEGANRAGKYSSVNGDQLYNGQTKHRSTQMQLSFQSNQSMPKKSSVGFHKSVIKGSIQYNDPSTSFNKLKWEAELEGCDDISFRFQDQESQSSQLESQEVVQDLSVSSNDNTSFRFQDQGSQSNLAESQEIQQDLSISLEDNTSSCSSTWIGSDCASNYQTFDGAESRVNSQASNEVETQDDGPVDSLQKAKILLPNSLQFQQIQEHSFWEPEELIEADESCTEDSPSFQQKTQNGNLQKLEGFTQVNNSNTEEPHSLRQQLQDDHFQEAEKLEDADDFNNEEHYAMHEQIQKCYFQEQELVQANELNSKELQINLLERAINCELEIIESKMNVVQRKSHPEQLQTKWGQCTLKLKPKNTKCEKVEQTFMREETRLENCRRKIHKLEMEMDGLIKERLDYMKRERQFELQKKILADALQKVNSLQRQLLKKEEENIECLLREKEIKARLYEIEVFLKRSRALSFEYPFHLCLPRSSDKGYSTPPVILPPVLDYFRDVLGRGATQAYSETRNLHCSSPAARVS